MRANQAPNAEVSDRRSNGPVWQPLCEGTYKINTDATMFVRGGRVGVGIIIHDYVGTVMASSAQAVQFGFSILIAEALAIKKGLLLARDMWLFPCFIESDVQVVVNLINIPDIPCSEVGLIIKDIKILLEEFSNCNIVFAPRYSNKAAHELARIGLSADEGLFWLEECPPSLRHVVLGDCPKPL
ncbi:hypothetical protein Dsin_000616 [Dipteronia sinensis]|uniref:RNase H type-1 domain-containing protein n=1 Tax=Dipteronia sinensis TaxID=43782 RepID=A0AAE0B3N6_9ROSI|nr:hypothetical protein Dsin_000616 [Dipteronia sinensis]